MDTLTQASVPVLAVSSGLSGTVAVAVGALVVVLAIVLVFVMVLRSNGAARKTASGLGYDAQRGPLGQPQPDASGSPWQRPQMQQAPDWSQNGEFGAGAPAAGRPGSAAWGQTQDYPGSAGAANAGRWPAAQGQPQGSGWDAPAAGAPASPWAAGSHASGEEPWQAGDSSWNAPQGPANRPAAGAGAGMNGGGGWDTPAAPAAGQTPWAAASGQPAAPWDQAGSSDSSWGAPAAPPSRPGAASGAGAAIGWGADMAPAAANAPDWGTPPAAPRQDWNAAPASRPRQDWNAGPAAAPAPQGFDVAGGFGEAEKTRVVRPSSQQSLGMIVVRQGKDPGRIFEVRKDRLTIGRSRESDIFLEDLAVSRLHTTVARDESGRYILRDENSANGTYVNGQRISEHVLDEGDEIQVGQTVLAFVRR